jgi:hypothetical protein
MASGGGTLISAVALVLVLEGAKALVVGCVACFAIRRALVTGLLAPSLVLPLDWLASRSSAEELQQIHGP